MEDCVTFHDNLRNTVVALLWNILFENNVCLASVLLMPDNHIYKLFQMRINYTSNSGLPHI